MTKLAIVVPCYNEQEVLPTTTKQLTNLLDRLISEGKITNDSFILYVNDGSRDDTWNIIARYSLQKAKESHTTGLSITFGRKH